MARRSLARRAAGAALVLCLAAVVVRPAAAQHEHHAVHPRVRAVIQAYYPSPANPSVLDWAEHIAAWNSMQILALQGILDIAALTGTCGSGDDPSCREDRARYAVRSQVMGLEQACPVRLSAGERASCLFAVYQELGSLEQLLHGRGQFFIMGLSNLWRVYAQHGRPGISRFRAIPELRRLAEMDIVLLIAFHVRVTAFEEKIRLLERIERDLAGQDWAREVPRGGLFVAAARMQLAHAELEQEQLWTYRSYSLASAGWEGPFREWLELTRHGTIAPGGLKLSPVRPQALFPRPPYIPVAGLSNDALSPPPAPPRAVPDRVRRGLYLTLARDGVVARERRSAIWVRGGRPIHLPAADPVAESADKPDQEGKGPGGDDDGPIQGPGGDEGGTIQKPGGDENEEDGTSGEREQDDEEVGQEPPEDPRWKRWLDGLAEVTNDLLAGGHWADPIAFLLERSPQESLRGQAVRVRALGSFFTAAELAIAIGRRDEVGINLGTIEAIPVIGTVAWIGFTLTGVEEKLRRMDASGRSVTRYMNHVIDEAASSLFPFRRPLPFSDMSVGEGVPQRKLAGDIRDYEQRLLDAAEDLRRQRGRFSIFR